MRRRATWIRALISTRRSFANGGERYHFPQMLVDRMIIRLKPATDSRLSERDRRQSWPSPE
jgi:hypothetical protein